MDTRRLGKPMPKEHWDSVVERYITVDEFFDIVEELQKQREQKRKEKEEKENK